MEKFSNNHVFFLKIDFLLPLFTHSIAQIKLSSGKVYLTKKKLYNPPDGGRKKK